MTRLILALVFAGVALPSVAQQCVPLAVAVAQMEREAFTLVRTVPIPESGVHLMLMRSPTGFLSAYTVIDGECVWGMGIPLGQEIAKDKGTPT